MNELYATRIIDRMLSGAIPFDKEQYKAAVEFLTKDDAFII